MHCFLWRTIADLRKSKHFWIHNIYSFRRTSQPYPPYLSHPLILIRGNPYHTVLSPYHSTLRPWYVLTVAANQLLWKVVDFRELVALLLFILFLFTYRLILTRSDWSLESFGRLQTVRKELFPRVYGIELLFIYSTRSTSGRPFNSFLNFTLYKLSSRTEWINHDSLKNSCKSYLLYDYGIQIMFS